MSTVPGSAFSGASYVVTDLDPAALRAGGYILEDVDIYGKVTRHPLIPVERPTRRNDGVEIGIRNPR